MTLPPPPHTSFRRPPLPPAAPHDSGIPASSSLLGAPGPAHSLPSSSSDPPLPISAPSASKPATKPVLHRIANPSNRQLAFSKCCHGLFKKAHELSVLCDAQVAAIVISSTGKVSEFSSPSMDEIIKRYEDFQPTTSNKIALQDPPVKYSKNESRHFKQKLGHLDDLESFMMGGDAMSLSLSELQAVDSQLELIMNKIRVQKMEILEMQTQKIISKDFDIGGCQQT